MVQARRRARRPRGDVRAGDVQDERARRPGRPRRRRRGSWPRPPSSAMSSRPMISRCSISKARSSPQDFARAAELMRTAADAGNPEAQYALATFYKEGRGVTKDLDEAARLLGARRALGPYRGRGRVRHRPVQRHRRRQERGRRRRLLPQGRAKEQPDRPEQAGVDVRDRPRHQGRPGRGRPLASDRQGRRRQRSIPRRLHAQDEAGRSGHGREQGEALDRAHEPDRPDAVPDSACRPPSMQPVKP